VRVLNTSPVELAGGFGLPGAAPLADRMPDSFTRQLGAWPDQTRRLVQLAAADPYGDRQRLWRAGGRLGIPAQAAVPAVEAGLVEFGTRVRFRLCWSARRLLVGVVRRKASGTRCAGRRDRPGGGAGPKSLAPGPGGIRAGRGGRGGTGAVGRAQARGGLAAAAAFLERSVLLTTDPARHAERVLTAAQVNMQAGAFGQARELLAEAEAQGSGQLDELASARVALLPELVEAAARRTGRAGPRCPQAAGGDYAAVRPRSGARHRGALPSATQP
jgi:hypothetical protein